MLLGVNSRRTGKLLGARWTPSPRRTCFKDSLHTHLSAESSKKLKGSGIEWKVLKSHG